MHGARPSYLHKLIVADEVFVGENLADGDSVDLLVACEGQKDKGQGGAAPAERATCSGEQPAETSLVSRQLPGVSA